MLTCQQFDAIMDEFLDGSMPFRQRLSMHMHLGICSDCRSYVRDYEKAIAIGQRLCTEDEQLRSSVPSALLEAVLQQIETQRAD